MGSGRADIFRPRVNPCAIGSPELANVEKAIVGVS